MIIKNIYHGTLPIAKIYKNGVTIFGGVDSASWEEPSVNGNTLTITQAYNASVDEGILTIE